MTIYDMYGNIPKEDVNKLVEYVCKKHHYVKKQDFEMASEYRDMEKDIYIKCGITKDVTESVCSWRFGRSALFDRLRSIYGNDLNYIEIVRDMKINDILQ